MGKKTKGINNKQSGGIDFIRAKKKVGRKIKKSNNVTDTTVRAKRINLSTQTLGAEGKGDAVTSRGLSMPELLNQTTHYSERVRKDALEGIRELLQSHPESLVASAATVVEKVAERLVDQEQVVRTAARAALKSGLLPALGPHGLAPFARRLVLHVGAALTHVAPAVRRDAPRVLEALLDAAPHLVGAHAPAATLRHLADLLRRGDDAASSSLDAARAGAANAAAAAAVQRAGGLAASFGDMTASRVGAATPDARLRLLQSCRRFLEVLAGGTVAQLVDGSGDPRGDVRATTWRWGDEDETAAAWASAPGPGPGLGGPSSSSTAARGIEGATGAGAGLALHAHRSARPPLSAAGAAADAFGGARASRAAAAERSDGREGVPSAAAELAALLFSAYDESTPTLADAGGPDLARVRGMTEALTCVQLSLRLVDEGADARGGVEGAAAAAAAPHVARRLLRVFPARAPAAAGGAHERRALVAFNAAAARLLSAVADGAARVVAADPSAAAAVDVCAADEAAAATAAYLAAALDGTALDAGPCGAPEPTAEGDYLELLKMARGAIVRPALRDTTLSSRPRRDASRDSRMRDAGHAGRDYDEEEDGDEYDSSSSEEDASSAEEARASLVEAVGSVWSRAVVEGPPERRAACVGLLAVALPAAAGARDDGSSRSSSSLPAETAARWTRPFARLLWELKHRDPATTARALRALREVASRTPPGDGPLATALAGVESELAPFFARVPPPPSDPTAPRDAAKPGPFSRLPPRCQAAAVELLGSLPTLSPATLRAVAHATLAPGTDPRLATRATEAIACNAAAAPLALTVSFLATALAGAPSWAAAKEAAPAAARALAQLGDPWLGASLAAPAVDIAKKRAERAGDAEGARRATYGALVAAAVAAESRAGFRGVPRETREGFSGREENLETRKLELAPGDAETTIPRTIAEALSDGGAWAGLTPGEGADADGDADGDEGATTTGGACARLLRAAPRWIGPVFAALRERAERAAAEGDVDGAVAAARAATATAKTAKAAKAEEGDANANETETENADAERWSAEARRCVEGLTAAADALVRGEAPGAARAAKAARLATLAVEG